MILSRQNTKKERFMPHIFIFRDAELYCHHTIDMTPDPAGFSMHAHEWLEIYYFISGSGSYLVEGNQYPLHPHDILIMRQAEAHKLLVEAGTPYERIAIHFSPSLIRGIDPQQRLLRPFLDRPLGQGNLYAAAEDPAGRLRTAFSAFSFEPGTDVRLNLTGRLLLLLSTLSGIYETREKKPTLPEGLQGKLVAYVNAHLFEDISLERVADAFFRSRSQVARIFHQATGSPLWEYVTIKRLLAARAMIERGESAGDACTACGFSDYSVFYRAYKAYFSHSPKADMIKK